MNNNKIVEKKITESIKSIDELDIEAPDIMTILNFISDEKIKIVKNQNKQFTIFSFIAITISIALVLIYNLSWMLFLLIQIITIIIAIGKLIIAGREKNDYI